MHWFPLLTVALAADLTVGPAGSYASIEDALDAAVDGDRILVDPGTYVERSLDVGARTLVLEATASGVSLQSTSNRRAFTVDGGNLSVIGFDIDLRDDIGLVDLNGGRFELRDSEVRAARAPIPGQPAASIHAIDGTIVITNSLLDGAVAPNKEGGHVHALRTDVVIDGSTLSAGDANPGGGVFLNQGSLTVTNSRFVGNVGRGGGAFDVTDATVTLTGASFEGNSGGALVVTGGDVTATNTTFSANTGGGLVVAGGSISLTGGVFEDHTDGAVSVASGTLVATSTTFARNTGDEGVAVLAVGSDVALSTARFEGNAADIADVVRCDGGATCTLDAPTFEGNGGAGALLSVRGGPAEVSGGIVCLQDASNALVSVAAGGSLVMTGSVVLANDLQGPAMTVSADSSAELVNNSLVLQQTGPSLVDASGALTLTNNLIALTTSSGPAVQAAGSLGGGYNLYFGNTGGDVAPAPLVTDLVGVDPGIGQPVAGSCDVDTIKPRYGSALIDAGDPTISDTDGSPSDIGAFGGVSPNPDPGTEDDDLDGDGFGVPADCNDEDPLVSPAQPETACNGVDDDCDPNTPDNRDNDGDGVGACDSDCDDEDPEVFEIVDVYLDQDGDGYGIGNPTPFCDPPNNSSLLDGDCDDNDAEAYPGAMETPYDGVDQDCDGLDLDDLDGDGALGAEDCDDDDPKRYPGADDVPDDGIDQDCTGNDVVTTLNGAVGWRCGCSASSGPAGASLGMSMLLLGLLRRRR